MHLFTSWQYILDIQSAHSLCPRYFLVTSKSQMRPSFNILSSHLESTHRCFTKFICLPRSTFPWLLWIKRGEKGLGGGCFLLVDVLGAEAGWVEWLVVDLVALVEACTSLKYDGAMVLVWVIHVDWESVFILSMRLLAWWTWDLEVDTVFTK